MEQCFANIHEITYFLVEKSEKDEDVQADLSDEVQEAIEKTHKVYPFTNNRVVPNWAKMLLY